MALQDLLNQDLTADNRRIYVQEFFNQFIENFDSGLGERSKTLGKAKSLLEFYDLVRQALNDYEKRASVPDDQRILFTEEEPQDIEARSEAITFGLVKRQPGGFGQGPPMTAQVKNLKHMLREIGNDPSNPGYRSIVVGYWHDNQIRFTCWAKTNKAANARAVWFENFMEEYTWWFTAQGVARVIYQGQGSDISAVVNNNRWFGRPLEYYVKTESLKVFSEKTLDEVIVQLRTKTQ
jgi:hypothetical protein